MCYNKETNLGVCWYPVWCFTIIVALFYPLFKPLKNKIYQYQWITWSQQKGRYQAECTFNMPVMKLLIILYRETKNECMTDYMQPAQLFENVWTPPWKNLNWFWIWFIYKRHVGFIYSVTKYWTTLLRKSQSKAKTLLSLFSMKKTANQATTTV